MDHDNAVRRPRTMALAGAALLVATVLTSCIKVNMDIELDDGKASGEMVLAVSQELLDLAGGEPGDLFDDSDVPEGATAEPYEDDDFVGQRFLFEDVELSEFNDEQLSITYDEDAERYELTGTMDFVAGEDLEGLPAGMAESMAESFDVSVSVTFHGEVIEHNGELDGRTVTWRPGFDDVTEMHAVAEEGGSGVPEWLWITLGVLAVALIGGLAFVRGRRGNTGHHDNSADGAHEPAADADATSPAWTETPDQPTYDIATPEPTTHHESPAEAAVHGDVASHGESAASEAVGDAVTSHEESAAAAAVHGDVAPHEESPASEAMHDDLAPHEESPPSEAMHDDVASHEQSPGDDRLT